jgi:hypothetical protein
VGDSTFECAAPEELDGMLRLIQSRPHRGLRHVRAHQIRRTEPASTTAPTGWCAWPAAESTGLAAVAVGSDGEYVSGSYNFTEFCHNLTRKSPEGLRRCVECDRKGSGTYLCHAGLVDFAAPITLEDGTLLGSIIGGQVLPEEPDEERSAPRPGSWASTRRPIFAPCRR